MPSCIREIKGLLAAREVLKYYISSSSIFYNEITT